MIKLKCVLADDEPIARQILEKYIGEMASLELVASCKNAFEVMDVLQSHAVDILFLDINMPKLSGISLLKTMDKRPDVIITTAYSEYAVDGFELAVTDYLLKPFSFERFLKAVMKVQHKKSISSPIMVSAPESEPESSSIFVKSDKRIIKLNFDEINYIEAYGNYIKIYAESLIISPHTLSDFLSKLSSTFMRVHKSYVINFEKLKMIDGNQIVLLSGEKIPIGKSYRKLVFEKVGI